MNAGPESQIEQLALLSQMTCTVDLI